MKRLILSVLLLAAALGLAADRRALLMSVPKPSSAGACSTVHAQNSSAASGNVSIGAATASYYVGLGTYNPGANISVCKVDWILSLGSGDISGKTFTCVIYAMSGNDFTGAALGTSAGVTGDNGWSGNTVSFTFGSPVAISSGGSYAIALTMSEVDGSNFARYSFSAAGGIDGFRYGWDSSGVHISGFGTDDPRIAVYK